MVQLLRNLSEADRSAVHAEATQLEAFIDPGSDRHELRVLSPQS